MKYTLGIIGAGNMAEAIVRASIEHDIVPAKKLIACDVSAERRKLFASLGIETTENAVEAINEAEQVMLAVKPQTLAALAEPLASFYPDHQILISIMAGVSTRKLEATVGCALRAIRVMPNTPMMAGLGMAGIARGEHACPDDEALTLRLFGSAGKAVVVDEDKIDAITAVSGSGPAYVFYLAEAMQKAAEALGLREHAAMLAQQTILGAAHLLTQSPDTAGELRRKVTSPGGTTEAAISRMEAGGVLDTIVDAIKAAEKRGKELGR